MGMFFLRFMVMVMDWSIFGFYSTLSKKYDIILFFTYSHWCCVFIILK